PRVDNNVLTTRILGKTMQLCRSTSAFSAASTQQGPLAGLSPTSFGIVMATGIVSLACYSMGLQRVGRGLFALNVLLYAAIWGLHLARLWRYPCRVRGDACDHKRALGFF